MAAEADTHKHTHRHHHCLAGWAVQAVRVLSLLVVSGLCLVLYAQSEPEPRSGTVAALFGGHRLLLVSRALPLGSKRGREWSRHVWALLLAGGSPFAILSSVLCAACVAPPCESPQCRVAPLGLCLREQPLPVASPSMPPSCACAPNLCGAFGSRGAPRLRRGCGHAAPPILILSWCRGPKGALGRCRQRKVQGLLCARCVWVRAVCVRARAQLAPASRLRPRRRRLRQVRAVSARWRRQAITHPQNKEEGIARKCPRDCSMAL